MRVPLSLPRLAGAAAVLLLATATPAQPPGGPATSAGRILALKPFPDDANDTALMKLQKQRFNLRLEAAKIQAKAVESGALNQRAFNELLDVLAQNGAAAEANRADRVKWLQMRVDVLKDQEAGAKQRVDVGSETASAYLLAQAARIDAEIDLLKLKDSLKMDKK